MAYGHLMASTVVITPPSTAGACGRYATSELTTSSGFFTPNYASLLDDAAPSEPSPYYPEALNLLTITDNSVHGT
jgi:hypothetical protein